MSKIKSLIEVIEKDFKENNFDKFIHDATFPHFKKIKPFTKIEFKFPLTVLVGANGGGKSSILHALYGMPSEYSTNRFWFSTPMDPISRENKPRYWYTYFIKNQKFSGLIEIRKITANSTNDEWESSRPTINDGMQKMPVVTPYNSEFMSKSKQRWKPVERGVFFINTKSDTSALDRFLYSPDITHALKERAFFIRRSGKLRTAVQYNFSLLNIGAGVFKTDQEEIPENLLEKINIILGKKYTSARRIVHNLFDKNKSTSVIFKTQKHTYSEAFAGSGELAVVNLVLRVEALKDFDLLLIDEPETSLHPGAQAFLIEYLLEKIQEKKLQIVMATHSPTIVNLLPENALIVLEEREDGIVVNPYATKSKAFFTLGHPDPNKITLLTEDKLLQAYVERALEFLPKHIKEKIEVKPTNTGVSVLLSSQVPAYMQSKLNVRFVLDGDQQPFIDIISQDINNLSPTDLKEIADQLTKQKINIVGSNRDISSYLPPYLVWCQRNIVTTHHICPEQFFLELLLPDKPHQNNVSTNKRYKHKVAMTLADRGDNADGNAQYVLFKSMLGAAIRAENESATNHLKALAKKIEEVCK